jgi:hypothetical protein
MKKTYVALLVALVAVGFALAMTHDTLADASRTSARDQIDFLAFYCAGKVSAAGADPYLAEPLRSCEAAAFSSIHFKIMQYLVVPAPLPPYVLALFALFGLLSYHAAAVVWFVLLLVATGVSFVQLRALTGLRPLVLLVPVLLAVGYASLAIGQLVPIVLCFVCAAALALRAGKPLAAAGFAVATLLEPNVGLPICLALFLWEPATRRALLLFGGTLGLLSLAYGGPERNLEYLVRVVPAQARAEGLSFVGQYSLSALLAQAGVDPDLALRLGSLSYVVMAALGIWLGGRLARVLGERAFVVLVPPALVLLGGAYVHIHQMAFALPLAFMLVARRGPWRAFAITALLLLAIPWQSIWELPFFYTRLPARAHMDVRPVMRSISQGTRLAEDEWGLWETLAPRDRRSPAQRFATKLPTWAGLIALLVAAFGFAWSGNQSEPSERSARASLRSITRA